MLFFENATHGNWVNIGTQAVDDYYYRNLDFDLNSSRVIRLSKVLDVAVQLFSSKTSPKLKGHEAIHIVLLIDSLLSDYTKSWQGNFIKAYDDFKTEAALGKKDKNGPYWFEYGSLTQTQSSEARTIQRRHAFFTEKMIEKLKPVLLDSTRIFGEVEREIVYYRDGKRCGVCNEEIRWPDLEIHHVEEHQVGGLTIIENGASVHKDCHPKGEKATAAFKEVWSQKRKDLLEKNKPIDSNALLVELFDSVEVGKN